MMKKEYTVLPLKSLVLFPYNSYDITVGRDISINAIKEAMKRKDGLIVCATQKNKNKNNIGVNDIYKIAALCKIKHLIKVNNKYKADFYALAIVKLFNIKIEDGIMRANIERINEKQLTKKMQLSIKKRIKSIISQVPAEYLKIPSDIVDEILSSNELKVVVYKLASLLFRSKKVAIDFIKMDFTKKCQFLISHIKGLVRVGRVEEEAAMKVNAKMQKSQLKMILNERIKEMKKEIGVEDEDSDNIRAEYIKKLKGKKLSTEAKEKFEHEIDRLSKIPPFAPESSVIDKYLDWLVSLPWGKYTKDVVDIESAKKILDENHYGLKKVKERIIEYIAIKKLSNAIRGPIICFVGPPGTGKTSLAKSIAKCLNRNFVRISLGGVRDEAEIRGHRRTYVGSLPGKIIQYMVKAGSQNPVFLLDEIDKMSSDFRGDPASALLEVLDPEQNSRFVDHYLEVGFDLSRVLFITTANSTEGIPYPLFDRMEIIRIPGYSEHEKLMIAKRFLIPRQLRETGLEKYKISISDDAIYVIIRNYTHEAGVRELERQINKVLRKIAMEIVAGKKKQFSIKPDKIEKYLGVAKYIFNIKEENNEIGVATGLAWTESGGDILFIEVSLMPGKGDIMLTGQLGDIMKESARAAISYIRSRSSDFGIEKSFYQKYDIHIHVPEGAIPKDGPSAGITIATALFSAITGRKVKKEYAMTGEITLRGKVLEIGGLKEKLLAAKRAGIYDVIVPKKNERNIKELDNEVLKGINIYYVSDVSEVFDIVVEKKPSKGRSIKRSKGSGNR